jgi:hypothetical protein
MTPPLASFQRSEAGERGGWAIGRLEASNKLRGEHHGLKAKGQSQLTKPCRNGMTLRKVDQFPDRSVSAKIGHLAVGKA